MASEFYTDTAGSNLYAGSTTGAPFKTYTSGTWVQATRTFTPAGGANPTADGLTVGMFVSIYVDGATAPTGYVARITTVGTTTFVTSATALAGTAPANQTLTGTAVIGGAWKGPTGASGFPFSFITAALTNAAGDMPRVNMLAGTYSVTAAITNSLVGPVVFQGYTTTPGDGGKATIDGGTSGASYVLFTATAGLQQYIDIIFQNNGATGSANGVNYNSASFRTQFKRCVFNSFRGNGHSNISTGSAMLISCEAYLCNASNTAGKGAFVTSANGFYDYCIAHDNAGSNTVGFLADTVNMMLYYDHCIADTNGGDGFSTTAIVQAVFRHCIAYNNTGDGIDIASGSSVNIENCHLFLNGGYGINDGAAASIGIIQSNVFGQGTQANSLGQVAGTSKSIVSGSITYTSNATPWTAPTTGNFTNTGATTKADGYASYTQTQASYTGTTSYPDTGATQHLEAGGMLVHPGMRGGG